MSANKRKPPKSASPENIGDKVDVKGVDAVDWGLLTEDNLKGFKPGMSGRLRVAELSAGNKACDLISDVASSRGFDADEVKYGLTEILRNGLQYGGGGAVLDYTISDTFRFSVTNPATRIFNPLRYSLMPVVERYTLGGTESGHAGLMSLLGKEVSMGFRWALPGEGIIEASVGATGDYLKSMENPGEAGVKPPKGSKELLSEDGFKIHALRNKDGSEILTSSEGFQVVFRCHKTQGPGNSQNLTYEDFLGECKKAGQAEKFTVKARVPRK